MDYAEHVATRTKVTMEPKIQQRLASMSYEEIADYLIKFPDDKLIALLNHRSIKIGDTATSILGSRGRVEMIADTALNDQLRTAVGKIRALNELCAFGKSAKKLDLVCLHFIKDKSEGVVSCALFGLCFLRYVDCIPIIKRLKNDVSLSSEKRTLYETALEALEAGNPFIYSPHYSDDNNIWKL